VTAVEVFWVAAGLILYSYLGYPLLLWLFTAGRRKATYPPMTELPTVTLLVTAFNEETVLRDKLENSFALDYPQDRLQIIVVSDGSTDGTDAVARAFEGRPGYLFLQQAENAGKTMAQNAGVRAATGEILVFSDANSMYARDAVQHLVRPFADKGIGCVCGELHYTNPQRAAAGKGEGSYWRYEQFLKRRESLLGSLVGANGSIYALRRSLFEELGSAIISDFIMPIRVRLRGHQVVYEPAAVAEEEVAVGFSDEFRRRRRIVARSIYGVWTELGALNPLRNFLFAFQLLSHKIIRWLVPVLMLIMLATSGGLGLARISPYDWAFGGQVLFYLLAMLGGAFSGSLGRLSLFYVPAYFCAINLGALFGILAALRGQRHTVWKPEARPDAGD
jgi:cellulose synthase/poly-beta-1,6-N-acetylglucosamine synthase-like glycosyltransferase